MSGAPASNAPLRRSREPTRKLSNPERLLSKVQSKLLHFFNWMGPSARDSSTVHVLRGFIKSALVYFVPVTLFRRSFDLQTLRRSVALGLFVAGVRSVDHVLKNLHTSNDKRDGELSELERFIQKYSLGVAGFVSALIALTVDNDLQMSSLVTIWACIRALRCAIPDIPGGAVLGMAVAAPIILPPYVFAPDELHPSYYKFLMHHGGKSRAALDKAIEMGKQGMTDACPVIHPGQTCTGHVPSFFLASLPRSMRVYVPVFILAFLLSHKRNLLYTVENIARSTLFLSTYCTMAWASMCAFNMISSSPISQIKFASHCWAASFAVLLERPSRRSELAAYCLTYAADRIFRRLEKLGFVQLSPQLNTLLLAISSGIVIYNRDQQPQMVVNFLFKLSSGK